MVWISNTHVAIKEANENTRKFFKAILPAFVFAIIGSMASCFAIVKGFENNVITRDQFIDMVEKNDIEGVRHALEQVGMDDMPSGKELLMQMQSGRQE